MIPIYIQNLMFRQLYDIVDGKNLQYNISIKQVILSINLIWLAVLIGSLISVPVLVSFVVLCPALVSVSVRFPGINVFLNICINIFLFKKSKVGSIDHSIV